MNNISKWRVPCTCSIAMSSHGWVTMVTAVKSMYMYRYVYYSETCLERPLSWGTTCLQRPHSSGRRSYISVKLNLPPKTTCLERPHFYGLSAGLSRQVVLYTHVKPLLTTATGVNINNIQYSTAACLSFLQNPPFKIKLSGQISR